jgi:hypothetical protein
MIKMRNVAIAALLFCATVQGYSSYASVCASSAADRNMNPLSFPVYYQEIVARFATPDEAATATVSMLPLPGGAKCSFGTRWDDSSPKHIAKAAMLERAGAKGGFYLCGRNFERKCIDGKKDEFFRTGARELVQRGHAVGNHTWSHYHMMLLSPDAVFRQIMTTRITLEDVSDHSIVSYASPYGWHKKSWMDVSARIIVEKMLVETGHYVSADNPTDGTPADVFFPANRFSANDRKPDYKAFKDGLAKQMRLAADGTSPRITLGTHSWCDEAGNALQESWIRKHCIRPDWVQLNDYEYGAYRYSYLNGKVSRRTHSDKVAVYSVRRFDPAALGDDIALSVKFSASPLSVTCAGKELVKDANGYWLLPHDDSRSCVVKVGVADENGVSDELPNIAMTLHPDRNASCIKVKISNRSNCDFSKLYGVVHLPPGFSARRRVLEIDSLAADSSVERMFPLGDAEKSVCSVDGQLFASSLDYTAHGERNRLWAMKETAAPLSIPLVRETAKWTDAVKAKKLDDEVLKAISAECGALRNPADGIEWVHSLNQPSDAWYSAGVATSRYIDEVHRKAIKDGDAALAIAYQFESKSEFAVLFTNRFPSRNENDRIFLNGEEVSVGKVPCRLPVKKGVNRIVVKVHVTSSMLSRCVQLALCNSESLGDPCKAVPFE